MTPETVPNQPVFVMPDVLKEKGEIERVAHEVFGEEDAENFFLRFLEAAKNAQLVELSEDM